MNPFGIERHRLVTQLSPEECRDRLSALLATQKGQWRILGGPPPGHPLTGTVKEDGFSVARFTTGRQSFKTFASGRLVPTPDGTEVTIRLGVHPIVLVFVAAMTLLVFSFVLLSLVGVALHNPNQAQESLNPIPLLMLGGWWLWLCSVATRRAATERFCSASSGKRWRPSLPRDQLEIALMLRRQSVQLQHAPQRAQRRCWGRWGLSGNTNSSAARAAGEHLAVDLVGRYAQGS